MYKLNGVEERNAMMKRKTRVYDVQNKILIAEFDTINEASRYTGVKCSNIHACMKYKYRSHKNRLGITITFR